MPFARLDGADLYFEVMGHGPPIIFVHGTGGNHLSWFQQAAYFAERFTVVTYDQRGWGRSVRHFDAPLGAAFVDDLCGLLDRLAFDQAHIVSHAMGGWTALGLAYRHPERVRSLVLSSTHGGIETGEIRTSIRLGGKRRQEPNLPFTVSRSLEPRWATSNPALALLLNQIADLNPPRDLDMSTHLRSINLLTSEQAATIRQPSLFVVGEDDHVIPPAVVELAAKLLPKSRIARLPATGHSVYFERPDIFNRMVEAFLLSVP